MISKFISAVISNVSQLKKNLEDNKERITKPVPLALWEPTVVDNNQAAAI